MRHCILLRKQLQPQKMKMYNLPIALMTIITLFLNCGPGTVYLIITELSKKDEFHLQINETMSIDSLSLKKITNKDIKWKITELLTIIEKYFEKDTTLIDDTDYLENLYLKISNQQKTKKWCLTSYCIVGDVCFPLGGLMLVFWLDVTPYHYLMPFVPPFVILSYLGSGYFMKRWYDTSSVSLDDIKRINKIITILNLKMKTIDEEEK